MKLYQVDAFTSQKFSGNPAGVCLVDEFPNKETMQNIASEMNLSETAFVKYISDNIYQILFFTPTQEISLCGHATLSSAHILFSADRVPSDVEIQFQASKDTLHVSKTNWEYTMDFPVWDFSDITQDKNIQEAYNITGISWIQEIYDTDRGWKILIIESIEALSQVAPRFWDMKWTEYGNVAVTCKWDDTYDYYMRCFVTDCGINEDPVTGSIECVLAPIWSEKLWKKMFTTYQASQRGWVKTIELEAEKVKISWDAVTFFETDIDI